jgi:Xaa-Pro aminopeptidase
VSITILPHRERAALRDAWLEHRLTSLVPRLMEEHGIDAWVLAAREYNEDPVLSTMLPATWMAARRRTILVFTDRGRSRAAVSRYAVGEAFPGIWDPEAEPDQWARLARHLADADPGRIAVDRSPASAFGDGLSAAEHDALVQALPERLRGRVVSAEPLAIGWLETRTDAERDAYRGVCAVAHEILAEGLSGRTIVPGTTTTEDLEWWLRDRVAGLGLDVWFHPTVSVQRAGGADRESFAAAPPDTTIEPGDLIHVDFGIVYLGLHTDMQQHAYVLRSGESAPPAGLVEGLVVGNRLQDLLLAEFAEGRTGNEILAAARAAAEREGIRPKIYTHPIGLHGHGAGPTIGLWDRQDGVPGAGDRAVRRDTAYSIELSAELDVPEWGGDPIAVMLEEEAFFDGERIGWIDGRQTALHLVEGPASG